MLVDCKNLAPIWEDLANDFANEPHVLIAKVDAEAENSKALATEQGVTSYPTIKFFPKGSKEPEPYASGRDEGSFVDFLNEKAGTHRAVGGALNAQGGLVESLDKIVAKYISGTSLSKVLAEAKKEAGNLKEQAQKKYAEYYVRVLDKLSQNEAYVTKELARLEGIVKKGGLAPAKLDELIGKTNILRTFTGDAGEEAKAEAKEEL